MLPVWCICHILVILIQKCHACLQKTLNSIFNWNSVWTSVSKASPLKQAAVCPECFIILSDAICVWNNHVYTLFWNCYVYTAVTTLLLCILGRFHSLLLCPSVFFHAAYCERSHQKVVEYFPQVLSVHHNIRSELCFKGLLGIRQEALKTTRRFLVLFVYL